MSDKANRSEVPARPAPLDRGARKVRWDAGETGDPRHRQLRWRSRRARRRPSPAGHV